MILLSQVAAFERIYFDLAEFVSAFWPKFSTIQWAYKAEGMEDTQSL